MTVQSTASIAGDKTAANSKTLSGSFPAGLANDHPTMIFLFAWKASVSNTISIPSQVGVGAGANVWDLKILGQRISSGLSGIAVIMATLTVGNSQNYTLYTSQGPSFSVTVNTGNITAWGADVLYISGGAPEIAFAAVGADSASTTSAAPTATSGSASIGDLVIGALSLAGPTGDTFTQDTDTTGGSWSTVGGATPGGTSGGSATTNQTVRGGYKIVTAAGTQTYNPTLGTARNYAELVFAIRPVTAKSGTDANGTTTETSAVKVPKISAEGGPGPTNTYDVNATTAKGVWAANDSFWSNTNNALGAADGTNATVPLDTTAPLSDDYRWEVASPSLGTDVISDADVILTPGLGGTTIILYDCYVQFRNVLGGAVQNTYTLETFGSQGLAWTNGNPLTFFSLISSGIPLSALQNWISGTWTMEIIVALQYQGLSSGTGALDAIDVVAYAATPGTPNTTESASLGGGSTPKSTSDANSTTTETGALTAALSASDADGPTSPVEILTVRISTADSTPTDTETASPRYLAASTDANSTTSENSAVAVPIAATDANGATTETAAPTYQAASTDQNGASSEISSLTAAIPATDTNGTTTENAPAPAQKYTTSDTATDTEVESLKAVISVTDANGATTETATQSSAITATDSNGTTTESGSVQATTQVNASDANGVTTEGASISAPVGASDSNGATTETAQEITSVTAPVDSGTDTETQTPVVLIGGSDQGTTNENGNYTYPLAPTADAGTDTETASPVFQITNTDAGSDTEAATPTAQLAGTDTGTEAEATKISLAGADAGADSETATPKANVTATDANSTTTENATNNTPVAASDSGTDTESATPRFIASGTDGGVGADAGTLAAKVSGLDGISLGSPSGLVSRPNGGASNGGTGVAWTNPANAVDSDPTHTATNTNVNLTSGQNSQELVIPLTGVMPPLYSVINGLEVDCYIEPSVSNVIRFKDVWIRDVTNGVNYRSQSLAMPWPTTGLSPLGVVNRVIGNSASDTWGIPQTADYGNMELHIVVEALSGTGTFCWIYDVLISLTRQIASKTITFTETATSGAFKSGTDGNLPTTEAGTLTAVLSGSDAGLGSEPSTTVRSFLAAQDASQAILEAVALAVRTTVQEVSGPTQDVASLLYTISPQQDSGHMSEAAASVLTQVFTNDGSTGVDLADLYAYIGDTEIATALEEIKVSGNVHPGHHPGILSAESGEPELVAATSSTPVLISAAEGAGKLVSASEGEADLVITEPTKPTLTKAGS